MVAAAAAPVSALVFHFTDTALSRAPERVTVKVIASPSSALASATANDGWPSSSVSVIAALVILSEPEAPVTSIVSLPSCRSSCVGVRSNVPDLLASPAAMTMSKLATAS